MLWFVRGHYMFLSTFYINTIETKYSKFNFHFAAVEVWNHLIDESIKYLPLKTIKNKVKLNILQSYCSWVFNRLFIFIYLSIYFFFFIDWLISLLKI